uniref:Uncharacterized protein n=1 Tax=Anopheles maculatus TaxID=74869 RepID=A0A182SFZ6_9DIPT
MVLRLIVTALALVTLAGGSSVPAAWSRVHRTARDTTAGGREQPPHHSLMSCERVNNFFSSINVTVSVANQGTNRLYAGKPHYIGKLFYPFNPLNSDIADRSEILFSGYYIFFFLHTPQSLCVVLAVHFPFQFCFSARKIAYLPPLYENPAHERGEFPETLSPSSPTAFCFFGCETIMR